MLPRLPLIEKKYGRVTAKFDRFEFQGRIACYVECTIRVKTPKPRGGFEMVTRTFNGNSLHVSNKDFTEIPDYEANRFSQPFIEIFKDFGIEPLENYEHFSGSPSSLRPAKNGRYVSRVSESPMEVRP